MNQTRVMYEYRGWRNSLSAFLVARVVHGTQRQFRARGGRAARITSTAGKQFQKPGKELWLILVLTYHFCVFKYTFVNEMTFYSKNETNISPSPLQNCKNERS